MNPTEMLDSLVADGIVDAVVQRVKTGKEAEVFVVRKGETFLAAKVYKERQARNFKNNAGYKEGRAVRNTRDQRAMTKGTKYGRAIAETEWMQTEHDALITAMNVGVRVPKPELYYEGILLMELVLGGDGQPAPRLIEVAFTHDEAIALHREIVGHIIKLLTCDLIHGDLSPYNVLMAWNGATIIDLPQVVKAAHNSQAEQYLVRDVRNITEHFARFAPELKKRIFDGYAIWKKYMKRELSTDYFPEEGEGQPPKREHVPAPQHQQAPRPHQPPREGPRPHAAHAPRPHAAPRPAPAPAPTRAPAPAPAQVVAPAPQRPAPAPRPHHPRPAPHTPHPRHAAAEGAPAQQRRPLGPPRPRAPIIETRPRLVPPASHTQAGHKSDHAIEGAAPNAAGAGGTSRFQNRHRRR